MKKIIVLLLTLIIALGLCACSNSDTANNKENKYIGTTWVVDDDNGMWMDELYSFRFLSDGKVIWRAYDSYDKENNVLVTDHSVAEAGEWILDDRQIIIFNLSDESVANHAGCMILNIDGNTLLYGDQVFTKAE